jgi:hypothetical protein
LAIVRKKNVESGGNISRAFVEEKVNALLEPFNEAIEVEEYDDECYCINSKANSEAHASVKAIYGDFGVIRDAFHAREDIISLRQESVKLCDILNPNDETEVRIKEISKIIDNEWQKHTAPFNNAIKDAIEVHPDKNKADPDCEDCKGSGIRQSTYNPDSKWDWYKIGGRWTGMFASDYDPCKDPQNIETCPWCNGTGTRTDLGEPRTCNGCNGTGQRVKFRLADFDGDILEMPKVIQSLMAKNDRPYAILTPEGEWAERGEMGWFGISNNEMSEDEWYEQSLALMQKYNSNEYVGVVVDCHI